MRIDDKLKHELEGISARDAAELICNEFGKPDYLFTFTLTYRTSTPRRIMDQKGAAVVGAEEISPISFYGGPPGNRRYYNGTLFTWLCDLVLHAYATNGNYADLVTNGDKFQTA